MRLSMCAIEMLVLAQSVIAQDIPTSVRAAEAEGASHAHAKAPSYTPSVFTYEFTGMTERKCATPPSGATGGSVRSGEIIIRSYWSGRGGPKTNRDTKILWRPLHNPFEYRDTLLIRAVTERIQPTHCGCPCRIGHTVRARNANQDSRVSCDFRQQVIGSSSVGLNSPIWPVNGGPARIYVYGLP